MTILIGMFKKRAVPRPGAYVFIEIAAIRCGKKALKIIEPKNPINTLFVNLDLGKRTYRKETK